MAIEPSENEQLEKIRELKMRQDSLEREIEQEMRELQLQDIEISGDDDLSNLTNEFPESYEAVELREAGNGEIWAKNDETENPYLVRGPVDMSNYDYAVVKVTDQVEDVFSGLNQTVVEYKSGL